MHSHPSQHGPTTLECQSLQPIAQPSRVSIPISWMDFSDNLLVGSHSAFESPARPSHAQPQHATTQPSSPSKNKSQIAAFNGLFNTPRRDLISIDDSSAGETPKSPPRDESDATPETTHRRPSPSKFDFTSMPALPHTVNTMEQASPRRDSFFGRIKKFCSPGRGEVPRGDVIHAKDARIRKKKSRTGRMKRHSDSSGDEDRPHKRSRRSPRKASSSKSQQEPSWITNLFTFIASHPTVPHILSFYAQLAFNVFLLAAFAYWIYSCWAAIVNDIDHKAMEARTDIIAEIAQCAEQFRINHCDSPTRVPALEQVCNNWAACMGRDPTRVARARVSAHTFAEILNSFIEPISYKAMIFTLLLVFGCFAISNFAFGLLREKTAQTQHYPTYQWQPPTPSRAFSGEGNGFYGTPWHAPIGGLEPQASGIGHIDGQGSPVRRLAFS